MLTLPVVAMSAVAAETADEWVQLGHRVHGESGSLLALGVRLGNDATRRLRARGRALDVNHRTKPAAPYSCVVDGNMLANRTSPGQDSLRIAEPTTDRPAFAIVEITDKRRNARCATLFGHALLLRWSESTGRVADDVDATP